MKAQFLILMLLMALGSSSLYAQETRPQFPIQFPNPQPDDQERGPRQLLPDSRSSQPAISRREASDIARRSYDGRVLSILQEGGQWRVRMDSEGTVFNVFVNAESGSTSRPSQ